MHLSPTPLLPQTARPVQDRFGRTFRYLRISVTDRCNLRCEYCSPNGACPSMVPEPLSWDDLFWMAEVAVEQLGVEALRITGGEPTVRPGLLEWIERLGTLHGLHDIAMTSNGVRLDRMAEPLARAGVGRVNISLDSLRPDRFRAITRGGELERVMAGISEAKRHFRQVKLNAVMLRDRNTDELAEFAAFSDRENMEVRFIEPMPLGDEKAYWRDVFVSAEDLRKQMHAQGLRLVPLGKATGFGPAETYRVEGTRARIGFISQMSCTKCAGCNKLRMTSDGTLRPCLLSAEEIPLLDIVARRDAEALAAALSGAFLARPKEYPLEEAVKKSLGRSMQCIGG